MCKERKSNARLVKRRECGRIQEIPDEVKCYFDENQNNLPLYCPSDDADRKNDSENQPQTPDCLQISSLIHSIADV